MDSLEDADSKLGSVQSNILWHSWAILEISGETYPRRLADPAREAAASQGGAYRCSARERSAAPTAHSRCAFCKGTTGALAPNINWRDA